MVENEWISDHHDSPYCRNKFSTHTVLVHFMSLEVFNHCAQSEMMLSVNKITTTAVCLCLAELNEKLFNCLLTISVVEPQVVWQLTQVASILQLA